MTATQSCFFSFQDGVKTILVPQGTYGIAQGPCDHIRSMTVLADGKSIKDTEGLALALVARADDFPTSVLGFVDTLPEPKKAVGALLESLYAAMSSEEPSKIDVFMSPTAPNSVWVKSVCQELTAREIKNVTMILGGGSLVLDLASGKASAVEGQIVCCAPDEDAGLLFDSYAWRGYNVRCSGGPVADLWVETSPPDWARKGYPMACAFDLREGKPFYYACGLKCGVPALRR